MENALLNAQQVTPEWLTAILREQGTLDIGQVTSVTPGETQHTFASSVWRLGVRYSPDAPASAPHRLFLKISNPALSPGAFDPEHLHQEIVFYREIAPAMGKDFSVPCYHAAYEPETGASHILLKDLSQTHAAGQVPACLSSGEQAVDTLARLHAFWWDHPRLGKAFGRFPTSEERQQEWAHTENSTIAFMAALGDLISPTWRAAYERVLPALPDLFKRHSTARNLTLVHGDAHFGNFLFPRDAQSETAYLIDWQFWHATIAATDLAFMMASEWDTETRRLLEPALLRRYYRQLLAHGVRDYSWDDCWNDYRLSIILVSIFIPVWRWAVFKWSPDLHALDRSMTAFADLKCSELLT